MDDDVELCLMIRSEFLRGSNRETAFMNIGQAHELQLPSNFEVSSWFERFCANEEFLKDEIDDSYYSLLRSIVCNYSKFEHKIFIQANWKFDDDLILGDRILFASKDVQCLFVISDLFNEESRKIEIIGKSLENAIVCYPFAVDEKHILINMIHDEISHLLLLKLDPEMQQASVISDFILHFVYSQIVFDLNDETNFLIFANSNLDYYKGRLSNNQIYIERDAIEFENPIIYSKLANDKIYAFENDSNGNEYNWKFVEYGLNDNLARKLNTRNCFRNTIDYGNSKESQEYIWSGNKLYVSCEFFEHSSVVAFDSEIFKWSSTGVVVKGHIEGFAIDKDEILTVSAYEYSSKFDEIDKMVYRFALRKPEKLSDLAWFTIRRGALFFGSKIYEKLTSKLPYNSEYRPFYENLQWIQEVL